MVYRFKSPLFIQVQDWLGLDDYDTDRVMTVVIEMAEENEYDFDEMSKNEIQNLAYAAFRVAQDEGMI